MYMQVYIYIYICNIFPVPNKQFELLILREAWISSGTNIGTAVALCHDDLCSIPRGTSAVPCKVPCGRNTTDCRVHSSTARRSPDFVPLLRDDPCYDQPHRRGRQALAPAPLRAEQRCFRGLRPVLQERPEVQRYDERGALANIRN